MRPSPPRRLIVFQCQLHCCASCIAHRLSQALCPSDCLFQCSEQLYEPLLVGSIPVYFGALNAADFAPQNSFINATEFDGPAALGAYLARLLKEPSLLATYHAWRTDIEEVNRFLVFAKVCIMTQARCSSYACDDLRLVTTD